MHRFDIGPAHLQTSLSCLVKMLGYVQVTCIVCVDKHYLLNLLCMCTHGSASEVRGSPLHVLRPKYKNPMQGITDDRDLIWAAAD